MGGTPSQLEAPSFLESDLVSSSLWGVCRPARTQKALQDLPNVLDLSKFALPECQHLPPTSLKRGLLFPEPLDVPLYLRSPVLSIRLGLCLPALVAVPETAVHEDHFPAAPKDHVGLAREIGLM